ncbi:metal-sensing transcriptional repressor [uncultured Dysosmobacter sp.]|uniref:metal-sensing transcriptional repressor n=1 Tax=uncultured Dysosmobacter sp. TaxID=2591384 RepID=UPI00261EDE84|nr:metal-sensing transcriptional repressor [uncultured Dysosmobacter sp.]
MLGQPIKVFGRDGKEIDYGQRRKHREPSEQEALLQRLNRIEGQVRGIRGMVEKEGYCTDILTQVSAVQSALNAFSRELLGSHIRTCVVRDIQDGDLEVVDDLLATIYKLMK